MDFFYNLFGVNNVSEVDIIQSESNINNENIENNISENVENNISENIEDKINENVEDKISEDIEDTKFIPSIEELKIGKNNLKKIENNKQFAYSFEDELKEIKKKLKKPLSYNTYVIKF